ncbi:MAG: transketolase C-terminal domain-containing protein, partial [Gloeomargarita sp. HHBFW_bins_162]
GIGAEITAGIMERLFDELDAPVVRLSSQDIPTPYNGTLERLTVVQPEQIVTTVVDLVSGRI